VRTESWGNGRGVETCDRCERREEERIAQSITFRTMCFRGANQRHVMMNAMPAAKFERGFYARRPRRWLSSHVMSIQSRTQVKTSQVKCIDPFSPFCPQTE